VHRAALSRFLLFHELPAELGRVLYLDVDLLVMSSLEQLLTTPLGDDQILAAVPDAYIDSFWAPQGPPLDLAPDDTSAPYFNAGVMLIDLPRWREEHVSERSLRLLEERELRFIDQCALNIVTAGRWAQLPPRWNLQARYFAPGGAKVGDQEALNQLAQAVSDPAIVHFTGAKPWQGDTVHAYAPKWFEVARRHRIEPPAQAEKKRTRAEITLATRRTVKEGLELLGRRVGTDVRLKRTSELLTVREQLTQRTGGVVAAGPFRGSKLVDHGGTVELVEIPALLGLVGEGPMSLTTVMGDSVDSCRVTVSPGAPRVVAAGLRHLGAPPPASDLLALRRDAGDLVVVTLAEFALADVDVGSSREWWILVDGRDTPAALAEAVAALGREFEVTIIEDAPPGPHHLALFRDLGPDAAARLRSVLFQRRQWIVATPNARLDPGIDIR
jgi:hypothetical protein